MENTVVVKNIDIEEWNTVREEAVDMIISQARPQDLEVKMISKPLQAVEPIYDYSKKSREELFAILDKFKDDPDAGLMMLPLDYYTTRPSMWSEKEMGLPLSDYLNNELTTRKLSSLPTHEERVEYAREKLRNKFNEKKKKGMSIAELRRRNDEARKRKESSTDI
jgi:hypothetical protein